MDNIATLNICTIFFLWKINVIDTTNTTDHVHTASSTGHVTAPGLCVFDQGGTTTSGDLLHVLAAIELCKQNHYIIAVVGKNQPRHEVCRRHLAICDAGVTPGDWYDKVGPNKTSSLITLSHRYKVSNRKKVILWDDSKPNRDMVIKHGFSTIGSCEFGGISPKGVQCFKDHVKNSDFKTCNQDWSANVGHGICAFDQSGTSTSGFLENVQLAIDACRSHNYIIAVVATSGKLKKDICHNDFLAICRANVLDSDWIVHGGTDKTSALTKLAHKYGVKDHRKVVLWDDSKHYRETVVTNGFSVIGSCHHCGIANKGVECFRDHVCTAKFSSCNQAWDAFPSPLGVPKPKVVGAGVCAFDQDGMTFSGILKYVQSAIEACKAHNYIIAVISASGGSETEKCIGKNRAICHAGVKQHDWYSHVGSDKSNAMKELALRYNIQDHKKVVLWDDNPKYRERVVKAGFSVIGNCRKCGLSALAVRCFKANVNKGDFSSCDKPFKLELSETRQTTTVKVPEKGIMIIIGGVIMFICFLCFYALQKYRKWSIKKSASSIELDYYRV